jgi:hypothetical protein
LKQDYTFLVVVLQKRQQEATGKNRIFNQKGCAHLPTPHCSPQAKRVIFVRNEIRLREMTYITENEQEIRGRLAGELFAGFTMHNK